MSQNQCPNCNTPVMPEAVFCHQCGHPISNAVNGETPVAQPDSWTRIWARLLDLLLGGFIVCLPLYYFLALILKPEIHHVIYKPLTLSFAGALFILLLDCAVFAVCGSTLGKFLFGIKMVENSGEPLKGAKYFQRNLRFYFSGIALGISPVFFATAIWQESQIHYGKQTSYDKALGCKPIVYKDSPLKRAIGFLCIFCIVIAIMVVIGIICGETMGV